MGSVLDGWMDGLDKIDMVAGKHEWDDTITFMWISLKHLSLATEQIE